MTTAAAALASLTRSHALREVDAAFARLLQRLGGSPEVVLAGALAMRAVALGHSGIVLDAADQLLAELDGQASLPEPQAWAAALRSSALVATDTEASAPLVFQHHVLALRRYARYEQRLADALRARSGMLPVQIDAAALVRLFDLRPGPPDRQALAAWRVQQQHFTLITGGPGTGKTSTVARLLALLMAPTPGLRIALAAPTGRAAARLGDAVTNALTRDVAAGRLQPEIATHIPRQAQTLHRLLGWQHDGSFRYGAALPLPFDMVVVDEASMIDLPLMAKLVDAVAAHARLVLLGDPDQLPAVEAGDVLGALCAAAGDGGTVPAQFDALCAALPRDDANNGGSNHPVVEANPAADANEGRTSRQFASADQAGQICVGRDDADADADAASPLAGHRVHLIHGYRQANAAGIAQLARLVQAGDISATCEALRSGLDGVHWIDLVRQPAALAVLTQRLEAEVVPAYRALAQAADPAQALGLATQIRVLTALRQGPAGAQDLNTWLAQRIGGANTWFRGRLLMITTNSYRHGLFNGDIGVCWPGPDGSKQVWFEHDGRLHAWSPGQLPAHETAYASTVHRAQGSEFDHVWLVLPTHDHRLLSRQLVYTGVTRARRSLHVVASMQLVAAALQRKAQRWSTLAWRL